MAEIVHVTDDADKALFGGSSCAFGVFDGVHRGHRFLIGEAKRTAARSGGASVALTFDVDPDELFAPDRLVKLMTNDQRLEALARTGVDIVAVFPFDRGFASLAPERFLDWAFGGYAPAHIHVGEGFGFGCRGAGGPADMAAWRGGSIEVHVHGLVSIDGAPVSATRVRGLLRREDFKAARRLLGRESYEMVAAV